MYFETAGLDRLRYHFQFSSPPCSASEERENYGFEYSGAEDPSRMASALELTDEEVLERL